MPWDSVGLPEPVGPMMAWTSPERMVRSSPWRISRPATPARRPRISRTCWRVGSDIDGHLYLAVDAACLVHGDGLGGGQGMWLTVAQREGAAVLPALELALLAEHLSLGQRDVLVAAAVVDGVDVVVDAHHRYGDAVDGDLSDAARRHVVERSEARRVGKECVSTFRSRGSP